MTTITIPLTDIPDLGGEGARGLGGQAGVGGLDASGQ